MMDYAKAPGRGAVRCLVVDVDFEAGLLPIVAAHLGLLHRSHAKQTEAIVAAVGERKECATLILGDLSEWPARAEIILACAWTGVRATDRRSAYLSVTIFLYSRSTRIRIFPPGCSILVGTVSDIIRRGFEMLLREFFAVQRMHNRAWIADGRLAIIGNR